MEYDTKMMLKKIVLAVSLVLASCAHPQPKAIGSQKDWDINPPSGWMYASQKQLQQLTDDADVPDLAFVSKHGAILEATTIEWPSDKYRPKSLDKSMTERGFAYSAVRAIIESDANVKSVVSVRIPSGSGRVEASFMNYEVSDEEDSIEVYQLAVLHPHLAHGHVIMCAVDGKFDATELTQCIRAMQSFKMK